MLRLIAGTAFAVAVVITPGCSSTRCDPCTQFRTKCPTNRCEKVASRDCGCRVTRNCGCGDRCDHSVRTVAQAFQSHVSKPQDRTTTQVYSSSQTGNTDADFVQEAAMANAAEIAMGRLAVRNGSTNEVRNFGQEMIRSHERALDDLERTASSLGFPVPRESDIEHGHIAASLATLSGSEFDRRFIDQMVSDHREAVSLFEARAATMPQNEIKDYASRTLPNLRHHLQRAEELQANLRD